MTVVFELEGQEFIALNGGPHFTFSPATSFVVNCETQQEVDELWEKLSEGERRSSVGGLKTNTVCLGKLSLLFWVRCCKTRTQRNLKSHEGTASNE